VEGENMKGLKSQIGTTEPSHEARRNLDRFIGQT
jgi:hypothetical protein